MDSLFSLNTTETDPEKLIATFFAEYTDFSAEEQALIRRAWDYLYARTKDIKRSCGKPYYLHPMRVACILAESKLDAECIVAGIFHNILEVQGIDGEDILRQFGGAVHRIICDTAKITGLRIKNKTLQQADSIRKMLFAMVDDIRVILVKLADRLDRMRNLKSISPEAQKAVAHEVLDIWAPLASRLGMSDVKNEMEDLSLKYSNPDVFRQIKAIVSQKKDERAEYLDKAVRAIYKSAEKAGIDISISSRAKHFYSIYQKMRKRGKGAEELYDLLALRIICGTNAECYTLVGIVHGLWKPLDGRFKDYIAMPKANGYQSLHTTVICEGKPLEIQIRTRRMHEIAEHGVASHWLYKKGTNHDMVSVASLSIINQLKALRAEHINDEAFFSELKGELLGDEIFVFTPKGDVVELPAGSTAIDFAYRIHSAIGEKIVGAKADGKIIPLGTPLKNTQIIDILTNPQAHPTANQLAAVRTSKARGKIRAWLIANDPTFEEKPAAKSGEPAEHKIPRRHRAGTENPESAFFSDGRRPTGKIRIANLTNFMVSTANCCCPKYPEPIVGYVSRGRGVIVHRMDCTTFHRIPNIAERTIEVAWDTEADPDFGRKKGRQ